MNEIKNQLEDSIKNSELGKTSDKIKPLTKEELNSPIEQNDVPELKSLDCRSECKYNTGSTAKYASYGYSD